VRKFDDSECGKTSLSISSLPSQAGSVPVRVNIDPAAKIRSEKINGAR